MSSLRAFTVRFGAGLAIVLGTWLATAYWIVPHVIRLAFEGVRIPVLSPMLTGRDQVPLDDYVRAWTELVPRVTTPLVTAVIVAYFVVLIARAVRICPAGPGWRDGALSGAGHLVLRWAVWFGLVTGLAEAYYIAVKTGYLHEQIKGFAGTSPLNVWLVPVADVLAFTVLGFVLLAILTAINWKRSGWIVPFVFVFAAAEIMLLVTGRIHGWAAVLLSTGIAYQGAHLTRTRWQAFDRATQRSLPWLAAASIGLGVAVVGGGKIAEELALRGIPPAESGAPNVLLIVLDTQRAASSSLYGYERETTPNLERLGARGIVFDRAIVTAPWSLPSHASIFTGRWNYELNTGYTRRLDGRYPTLAQVFGEHGYATAAFVANLNYGGRVFGLDRGFQRYETVPLSWRAVLASAWPTRTAAMSVLGKLGRYREFPRVRAPSINERLLRWLGNRPARPFFAFLNYFDVHEPYDPPPPFDTMYEPVGDLIWRQKGQDTTDYTPHELEQLRARYDGAIAYLDDQLGQLLQEMSSRGALENTVVIITSDHGEALGEHGGIGHFGLQWRTLHVPLVVLDPHGGPAGRRVEVPVSLRDLPATIADLVNLDDSPFPGTSLRWRWEMGSGDVTAIDPIMSEADGGGRSVVLGPWHYVDWPGQPPRLYDYGNDPLEERNLYDSLVSVDSAALLDSLRQVVRRSRPWQSP